MTTYKPFLQQYRDAINTVQQQGSRVEELSARIPVLRAEIPVAEYDLQMLETSLKEALVQESGLPANSQNAQAARKLVEEGKYKEAYQMVGEIKDYILVDESNKNYTASGVADFLSDTARQTGYDGMYALVELSATTFMQPFGKIWWEWCSFGKFRNYNDHSRMEYGQALAAIPRLQQEHGRRVRIIWGSSRSEIGEKTAETISGLATAGNPVTFFSCVKKDILPKGIELLLPHAEIYILGRNKAADSVICQYAKHLFTGSPKPTEGLVLSPEQKAEWEEQRRRQQEQEAAERERRQVEEQQELEALLK